MYNAANPYGRWRLHSHTDALGNTRSWTYTSLTGVAVDRQDSSWGVKDELVVVAHPQVTLSTGGVAQTYSEVKIFDVSHPTLSVQGDQSELVGQVLKSVDADGVVTDFSYDSFGRLAGSVTNPGAGVDEITATFTFDRWGALESTTENASAAKPLTTTVVRDGRGAPRWITSTVEGVPHVQRFYYDEWGNTAVVLSTNKTSTGAAPDDFRPGQERPDTARDWLRDEWHYKGGRLLTHFADRRSLDRDEAGAVADASDARFARTDYTWSPDGWLLQVVGVSGAVTDFAYDGFGSLFKSTKSGGGSSVRLAKYFVNNALEVSRTLDGLGNATVIERNPAGVISKIIEPPTPSPSLPAGYSWSAAQSSTSFVTDALGRMTEVSLFDVVAAAPVVKRKTLFDKVGRVYEVQEFKGADANPTRVTQALWSGASTVSKVTYPSGRYVERDYDSLKRLKEARDGMASPSKVVVSYLPNSPFSAQVERWSWDEGAATPGYVKRPVAYVKDNLGRVLEQQIMPSDPLPSGSTVTTPLVHEFRYYTSGATESHTDPSGKVERYLPDAMGRLNERFLSGASPIWNGTNHHDWTGVAARSKLLLTDGLGQSTSTTYDFAGRPVVVMEPGASVEPTAANPHQAFARLMTYDAASRLDRVFASEDIEIEFHRAATGQLLQRHRVVDAATINNGVVSWLWDRDNLRHDALGQLVETSSFTLLDDEYINEVFDRDAFGRTLKESYSYVATVPGTGCS